MKTLEKKARITKERADPSFERYQERLLRKSLDTMYVI